MSNTGRWLRNQIASYGAAIAIIVDQLSASPGATIAESPNPLVRIRSHSMTSTDWDPDELVTHASGRTYVLVWDYDDRMLDQGSIQAN